MAATQGERRSERRSFGARRGNEKRSTRQAGARGGGGEKTSAVGFGIEDGVGLGFKELPRNQGGYDLTGGSIYFVRKSPGGFKAL